MIIEVRICTTWYVSASLRISATQLPTFTLQKQICILANYCINLQCSFTQ